MIFDVNNIIFAVWQGYKHSSLQTWLDRLKRSVAKLICDDGRQPAAHKVFRKRLECVWLRDLVILYFWHVVETTWSNHSLLSVHGNAFSQLKTLWIFASSTVNKMPVTDSLTLWEIVKQGVFWILDISSQRQCLDENRSTSRNTFSGGIRCSTVSHRFPLLRSPGLVSRSERECVSFHKRHDSVKYRVTCSWVNKFTMNSDTLGSLFAQYVHISVVK